MVEEWGGSVVLQERIAGMVHLIGGNQLVGLDVFDFDLAVVCVSDCAEWIPPPKAVATRRLWECWVAICGCPWRGRWPRGHGC